MRFNAQLFGSFNIGPELRRSGIAMSTTLFIKNMVCDRCKMVVEATLRAEGFHPKSVTLGGVELEEPALSPEQLNAIAVMMQEMGFELLTDKNSQLVEGIRTAIIDLIHHDSDQRVMKHSEYLAQRLGKDYYQLSRLFSESEGTTIEQYIILQKIERAKELLSYGEQTLSDISFQLGYSSVAALSSQFKKVVGMTPTAFKDANVQERKTLDRVGK